MADQFQSWLSSLPAPNTLAPEYGAQRGQPGYIRGVPEFLGQNQVPAMWRAFAPYGKSLIDRAALSRMRGTTAGIAGGRREFERSLLNAYQAAGVNPLFARGQLAESRPAIGGQIATARGEIEAQRADETFNLQTGLLNALVSSYLSERGLGLELYAASKGRQASREGAKSALSSSLLSAGLGAAGMFFGGPAFGSLFGGGGAAAGTAGATGAAGQVNPWQFS